MTAKMWLSVMLHLNTEASVLNQSSSFSFGLIHHSIASLKSALYDQQMQAIKKGSNQRYFYKAQGPRMLQIQDNARILINKTRHWTISIMAKSCYPDSRGTLNFHFPFQSNKNSWGEGYLAGENLKVVWAKFNFRLRIFLQIKGIKCNHFLS